MKAVYKSASPYLEDEMNLPVKDLGAAIPLNGLDREEAGFRIDQHGDNSHEVFFVVAPDGLCYCLGERQN